MLRGSNSGRGVGRFRRDLQEHRFERALMRFSNAVADRFFLQGASAVPTVKLMGLA